MQISEKEMAKAYDPRAVEARWYDWWDKHGYFTPKIDPTRKPFTIIMPPPNVTGELHMGHALFVTVEDILTRWRRMQGYPTLWLPGADHAGIAGQWVVEKELAAEGLTRHDLGREKFLERTWDWMNRYRGRIREQLRILGASCDWSRFKFTMDPEPSRAVRTAFKRLYDEGLIYRGKRMINWCPRCMTALSDLEVDHEEVKSHLWTLRYPIDGTDQFIEVATTRPETMLGDTAVAVHPDDERYRGIVGRTATLPIIGRKLQIVADELVDPEFGSGAVKVTPAHDPTDFEIGQKHNLPAVNILNLNGTLNENAGPFAGQTIQEARRNVVRRLEEEGFLVRVEDYTHSVAVCDRCESVIEPIISEQWFLRMDTLNKPALEAVRNEIVRMIPDRFKQIYINWVENEHDWCISRQLWWGHRIPIWYCRDCGHTMATDQETLERCEKCGSTHIEQDPDVLDTWFSSALWPMSTLGWPDDTDDLRYFYPTSVMETGYDIIFLWVHRMIFMGLHFMGEVPFFDVYFHGTVRDEKGQRMSKTKGNVLDPTEITEQYGSDALRFALITSAPAGSDMKLGIQRVEAMRNFANKIWNATRYVIRACEDSQIETSPDGDPLPTSSEGATLADKWIISRLHRTIRDVTNMMERYQLHEAGRRLYDFIWSEYCDWYIESTKVVLAGDNEPAKRAARQTLVYVLERALRLLHPYMPFVTEELWHYLPHKGESIMIANWPEGGDTDSEAERQYELVTNIIRAIRNVRAERDVPTNRLVSAMIIAGNDTNILQEQAPIISRLARVDQSQLRIEAEGDMPSEDVVALVIGNTRVYLPLTGLIDIEEERKRLNQERDKTLAEIERVRNLLSNEQFTSRAPEHVVQRERDKLMAAEERLRTLDEHIQRLGKS